MAFTKVEKTGPVRNDNIKARFTISGSHSSGTLGITNAGWEFLKQHKISLAINDTADLYFDDDTGAIAIKKIKNGQFKFSNYNGKTVKLSSKDLAKRIVQETEYDMDLSKEFDVILKVVRKVAKDINSNVKKTR